jgi:DNA-binding transcriptional ArsR family regulator
MYDNESSHQRHTLRAGRTDRQGTVEPEATGVAGDAVASQKTVEQLAADLLIDVKLIGLHLKVLKEARLVPTRRDGKYIHHRLSGHHVAQLGVNLREVAEEHLVELRMAVGRPAGQASWRTFCRRCPESAQAMDFALSTGTLICLRAFLGVFALIALWHSVAPHRPQADSRRWCCPWAICGTGSLDRQNKKANQVASVGCV